MPFLIFSADAAINPLRRGTLARGGANGEFINNERLFAATNVAYSVASTP